MLQPLYATREQVKRALNSAETARNNAQVDRAIASASRSIESQMHRKFYPSVGTRYFGFRPWVDGNSSWRMWLNENDLVSVTSLSVGGTTISSSDYFLEPVNSGPPYTHLEMDLSSNSVLQSNDTWQRAVAITGTWGYSEELEEVGTLFEALDADATDAANVTWTNMAGVGVGSILKIDTEYLTVSDVTFVDTTQNTSDNLTASAADNSITVFNVDEFFPGQVIQIGAEKMLVVEVTTSSPIIVKRAWDGSVLATHAGASDIYARTGAQINRAQLGSTLAAHTPDDVVYRVVIPAGINDLCIAEALVQLQGEQSAYARAGGGSGESQLPSVGTGLQQLRKLTVGAFGRKARTYAI